jgi:RNA polymerase sigma factor (sigma-70 family)
MRRLPTVFRLPDADIEGLTDQEVADLTQQRIWALVFQHRGMCYAISEDFLGRGLDRDDLVQEGLFGLYRAVELYNPAVQPWFAGYARLWIRESMGDACLKTGRAVRIPKFALKREHRFKPGRRVGMPPNLSDPRPEEDEIEDPG